MSTNNYKYRCLNCDTVAIIPLPISFEPKKKLKCEECDKEEMVRRILRCQFPEKVGKVYAGDWFKKTYGYDIREPYEDKARQKEDMREMEKKIKRQMEGF